MILTSSLILAVCLLLLVLSADKLIDSAIIFSQIYKMPPHLVGMLIVGFGTSLPEIIVSSFAAWEGSPGLAAGNAYGSNIANIALVFGVACCISPVSLKNKSLAREILVLLSVTLLSLALLKDHFLSSYESYFLVISAILLVIKSSRSKMDTDLDKNSDSMNLSTLSLYSTLFVSLLVLLASSKGLVWSATNLATAFGVSSTLIGLSIIALGTSLPELVATIVAARKQANEMAVGNIVGSNLFNSLFVIGLAGSIHPIQLSPDFFNRDLLAMTAITVAFVLISLYALFWKKTLGRIIGCGFITSYFIYIYLLATSIS